jgi:hypothetical protein
LINVLLLSLCFFGITDVKAETDYYDDEGNLFRLVFDDTPLRNFVKTDFAIVYDDLDYQGKTIARFDSTSQSGTYQYSAGYAIENELIILIFETSEKWQQTRNEKYIVNVLPDYIGGSNNAVYPCIFFDQVIYKDEDNLNKIRAFAKKYTHTKGFGTDLLNFRVDSNTSTNLNGVWRTAVDNYGVLLSVDKNGNWQRLTDLYNTNRTLYSEISGNAEKNVIYSSKDIYSYRTKELLISKEEFETRTITSNYSLTCHEENPYIYDLHFDINDLKANEKVVITYNDDSIVINETLTEQKNSFSIENAKTGNYNVKVYDENNELIHENDFEIEIERNINIDYSLGCDEDNPFFYNIYFNIKGLVKDDKVVIKKDNIKIKESLINWDTIGEEIIDIQGAESGKYLVIIYNKDNEEIYQKEFDIIVDQIFFTEDDTALTLIDKIKNYLKAFKDNLKIFYEGFESIFNSLNFELKTGIFIIITIFIIVYIIKIVL